MIEPRVAFLSCATLESAELENVEKMREAVGIARRKFPKLRVEGPIQGDAALDETVAMRKGSVSEVAGRANVLIFPNVEAGNIAYKLVEHFTKRCGGDVHFVGPVILGTSAIANDASRGATQDDLLLLGMVTALQARERIGFADQDQIENSLTMPRKRVTNPSFRVRISSWVRIYLEDSGSDEPY